MKLNKAGLRAVRSLALFVLSVAAMIYGKFKIISLFGYRGVFGILGVILFSAFILVYRIGSRESL